VDIRKKLIPFYNTIKRASQRFMNAKEKYNVRGYYCSFPIIKKDAEIFKQKLPEELVKIVFMIFNENTNLQLPKNIKQQIQVDMISPLEYLDISTKTNDRLITDNQLVSNNKKRNVEEIQNSNPTFTMDFTFASDFTCYLKRNRIL
jgi:hypothetical protein